MTKQYADQAFLQKSGGTLSGNIDANLNRVLNLPLPTEEGEASNKKYVDSSHVSSSGSMKSVLIFSRMWMSLPRNMELMSRDLKTIQILLMRRTRKRSNF